MKRQKLKTPEDAIRAIKEECDSSRFHHFDDHTTFHRTMMPNRQNPINTAMVNVLLDIAIAILLRHFIAFRKSLGVTK